MHTGFIFLYDFRVELVSSPPRWFGELVSIVLNAVVVRVEERAPAYQALGQLTLALGVDGFKCEVKNLVSMVLIGLEDATAAGKGTTR